MICLVPVRDAERMSRCGPGAAARDRVEDISGGAGAYAPRSRRCGAGDQPVGAYMREKMTQVPRDAKPACPTAGGFDGSGRTLARVRAWPVASHCGKEPLAVAGLLRPRRGNPRAGVDADQSGLLRPAPVAPMGRGWDFGAVCRHQVCKVVFCPQCGQNGKKGSRDPVSHQTGRRDHAGRSAVTAFCTAGGLVGSRGGLDRSCPDRASGAPPRGMDDGAEVARSRQPGRFLRNARNLAAVEAEIGEVAVA